MKARFDDAFVRRKVGRDAGPLEQARSVRWELDQVHGGSPRYRKRLDERRGRRAKDEDLDDVGVRNRMRAPDAQAHRAGGCIRGRDHPGHRASEPRTQFLGDSAHAATCSLATWGGGSHESGGGAPDKEFRRFVEGTRSIAVRAIPVDRNGGRPGLEERRMTPNHLTPARILETATAFWPAKVLLSAIELGLFTRLVGAPLDNARLAGELGIRADRSADFFDALVAMGFLERDGNGAGALYRNTPETDLFLDKNKPSYTGGLPEMLNARLYGFWNGLTDALRTGQPQNEAKGGGAPIFATLYADEARLEQFLLAMAGIQMGNFATLANQFDFTKYKSVCDVGGANGALCRALAARHPHLSLTSYDLPAVAPIARREIAKADLVSRIEVVAGDFFADALPKADVVVMGNILHDWNESGKRQLVEKAYAALPAGGVFIAIENIIDDDRRQNAFGLLMSLNMLIEFGADGGFDYTGAQFDGWCRGAGFTRTEIVPLVGPTSAAIAYK